MTFWIRALIFSCAVFELTGLGRGGQQVQQCKKAFKQAVELLVELASMQVCYCFRFPFSFSFFLSFSSFLFFLSLSAFPLNLSR